MRIIVTGAKGFVGKEIVAELLKNEDNEVFEIGSKNRLESLTLVNENRNKYFSADITEYENLKELQKLEKIDAVVHSAGLAHQFGHIEKEEFFKVNVSGTKNVVDLAVKINAGQFILISSTAIYGLKKNFVNQDGLIEKTIIDENTACLPETFYADSKLEAEKLCIAKCRENGLPLTILRLAPVIGENNVGNVARLISAIDRRRFIRIGKGENLKTLIYKNDVARAVVTILKHKKNEIEIFNVAGKPIAMKEFVGEIEKHLTKNVSNLTFPIGILQKIFSANKKTFRISKINKISETLEKWLSDDIYSARKIRSKYNYEPQTSTAEALERQIKCYLTEKNKD